MAKMESTRLQVARRVRARDGSDLRILPTVGGASMAHASLPPGAISQAVYHRTVEEIWSCVSGRRSLWRSLDGRENVIKLRPGVSASIPRGTRFQFRNDGDKRLAVVIATAPPSSEGRKGRKGRMGPGGDEAVACDGLW